MLAAGASTSKSLVQEDDAEFELPAARDAEMSDDDFDPNNHAGDPDDGSRDPNNIFRQPPRNTVNLSSFIAECDRYRISNAGAAALHNSLLTCYGVISDQDRSKIITKSKIRSSRKLHQSRQREK